MRNRVTAAQVAEYEAKGLVAGTPAKPARKRPTAPVELIPPGVWYGPGWLTLDVPMRAVNQSNQHSHWRTRAGYNRRVVETVANMLCTVPPVSRRTLDGPVITRLARVAPKGLDRHDNLRQALKPFVDVLAVWLRHGHLGQRDGNADLEWLYDQERDGRRYGVRIRLEAVR